MKTLRDALATVIDGIKATAGFNAIYYQQPTSVPITPAVVILIDGGNEEFETTQHNSLILDVTIRVMVEKIKNSADNDKTETDKVLTISDAILAELRKKSTMTLSGASYYMLATNIGKLLVSGITEHDVHYQDLKITVKSIKDVTT